ncbi:MAG: metal ABC transporter ATP-binding protein [Epsilonproteobacteria bacterium]|nr:metal ABC transporter ATP-binding protein [Campylobacterota bacterium]
MEFKVPIFDVRNLTLVRKSQTILRSITLQIFEGEYVAIIGPNGGGKTTFVRTLLGLESITSGEIYIYTKPLKSFSQWSKIGYVPQRATLVDKTFPATAYDIVKMGRDATKGFFSFFTKEDKEAVFSAMQKMDVWHLRQKLIGELSGGQRQRVMIARALVSNPRILILDEPNTGVDVKSQKIFYALLKDLHVNEGITIVFITHDIGVIADDITKLVTINQKARVCHNPKEMMSCEDMSELYGIEAHLLQNHKVGAHVRI